MTASEQKALFRFQIIHPLLDDRLGKGELSRMVREASEREYVIPGSRKTTISESTIWSWYKTYLKTRNIASLVPKNRNDKGKRRKITGETADRLLQFRIDNPGIPLTALVKKAEKQGIFTASDTIRMSGIYSFFREHELELDPKAGKDMRRFEVDGVLDLLQSICRKPEIFRPLAGNGRQARQSKSQGGKYGITHIIGYRKDELSYAHIPLPLSPAIRDQPNSFQQPPSFSAGSVSHRPS